MEINNLRDEIEGSSKRRRITDDEMYTTSLNQAVNASGSFSGGLDSMPMLGYTTEGHIFATKYLDPSNREYTKHYGIPDLSSAASHSIMADQTNTTITVNDFIVRNNDNREDSQFMEKCPLFEKTILPEFQVISFNIPEIAFGIYGTFWYVDGKQVGDKYEYFWTSRKAVRLVMNKKYLDTAGDNLASRQTYRGLTVMDLTNELDKQGVVTGYVIPTEELFQAWHESESTKYEEYLFPVLDTDAEISGLHRVYTETYPADRGCYIANRVVDGTFDWMRKTASKHLGNIMNIYKYYECTGTDKKPQNEDYVPMIPWDDVTGVAWCHPEMVEAITVRTCISAPEHWSTGYIRVQNCKLTATIQIKSYIGHQIITLNRLLMNSINPPCKYDIQAMNAAIYFGTELNYVYPGTYNLFGKIGRWIAEKIRNPTVQKIIGGAGKWLLDKGADLLAK